MDARSTHEHFVVRGPEESAVRRPPAVAGTREIGQRGNLIVASWVIGCDCVPDELGDRLSKSLPDVIVLVMSTAVADTDAIYEYLSELAKVEAIPHDERGSVSHVNTEVLMSPEDV